jgi:hypothetical protein
MCRALTSDRSRFNSRSYNASTHHSPARNFLLAVPVLLQNLVQVVSLCPGGSTVPADIAGRFVTEDVRDLPLPDALLQKPDTKAVPATIGGNFIAHASEPGIASELFGEPIATPWLAQAVDEDPLLLLATAPVQPAQEREDAADRDNSFLAGFVGCFVDYQGDDALLPIQVVPFSVTHLFGSAAGFPKEDQPSSEYLPGTRTPTAAGLGLANVHFDQAVLFGRDRRPGLEGRAKEFWLAIRVDDLELILGPAEAGDDAADGIPAGEGAFPLRMFQEELLQVRFVTIVYMFSAERFGEEAQVALAPIQGGWREGPGRAFKAFVIEVGGNDATNGIELRRSRVVRNEKVYHGQLPPSHHARRKTFPGTSPGWSSNLIQWSGKVKGPRKTLSPFSFQEKTPWSSFLRKRQGRAE